MQLDAGEMNALISRLNRAQGQIGGIVRMIEEGRECKEIITQIAAVSKALDRAGFSVIAAGLQECLGNPEKATDIAELEKMFLSLA